MTIEVNGGRTDDKERHMVRFTLPGPIIEDFDPSARVTLVIDVDDKVVENNLGLPVI